MAQHLEDFLDAFPASNMVSLHEQIATAALLSRGAANATKGVANLKHPDAVRLGAEIGLLSWVQRHGRHTLPHPRVQCCRVTGPRARKILQPTRTREVRVLDEDSITQAAPDQRGHSKTTSPLPCPSTPKQIPRSTSKRCAPLFPKPTASCGSDTREWSARTRRTKMLARN